MIEVKILGAGDEKTAKVTANGQLVVAPIDYSTFYSAATAVNDTAVNVVPPVLGKNFVITAIILSGDRSIGANGAITDLFENNTSGTDGTIEVEIYQDEIAKQTRTVLTGLNIKVKEGRWVNVKSDDVIVRANVAGYYVDA